MSISDRLAFAERLKHVIRHIQEGREREALEDEMGKIVEDLAPPKVVRTDRLERIPRGTLCVAIKDDWELKMGTLFRPIGHFEWLQEFVNVEFEDGEQATILGELEVGILE